MHFKLQNLLYLRENLPVVYFATLCNQSIALLHRNIFTIDYVKYHPYTFSFVWYYRTDIINCHFCLCYESCNCRYYALIYRFSSSKIYLYCTLCNKTALQKMFRCFTIVIYYQILFSHILWDPLTDIGIATWQQFMTWHTFLSTITVNLMSNYMSPSSSVFYGHC